MFKKVLPKADLEILVNDERFNNIKYADDDDIAFVDSIDGL